MKRIQYSVWKKETNNAGGKAKNDAFDIALGLDFAPSYKPSEQRIIRVAQQYLSMQKFRGADAVFMQYPAVDFRLLPRFIKRIESVPCSIALIHDLRIIQGLGTDEGVDEISLLNKFRYVISHNRHMTEFLLKNGCKCNIIELELFDYLHDVNREVIGRAGDGSVAFAGNLVKSTFISKLSNVKNVKFNLYGNKGESDFSSVANIDYKGSLPSNEIVYGLEGDYGLVWDGDSIETCSGKNGEYLRFNNPHKLSLYIASGKPVITWSQSAVADFVKSNGIGICVDSLKDLEYLDLSGLYEGFCSNISDIKEKISRGYYLSTAIDKCLNF